ncbi:MAG TPA: hypothetical protein VLU25_06680 [Acidobacteriota bacterium]|nr:hypothetical protein [Acidobacteriota bacterium]
MQKIHSVESVTLAVLDSDPNQLLVTALGHVVSSGWTDSQLLEYSSTDAPEGGILKFDFAARPPQGAVLPSRFPILAQCAIEVDIASVKGVRVRSSSNEALRNLRVGAERHAVVEGTRGLRDLAGQGKFSWGLPPEAYLRPDQAAGEVEQQPGVLLGGTLRKEPVVAGEGTGLFLYDVLVEVDAEDIPQAGDYVDMLVVARGQFELKSYPRRGKVWTFVAENMRPHSSAE